MKRSFAAFSVFALTLLIAQSLLAQVLVVSDIDDTIKVSHILSKAGAVSSALDEKSHFSGMPQLYRALQKRIPSIEFHYVSLAPRILMHGRHADFLAENGFPVDGIYTNPGIKQDPELKQQVIRKLIESKRPEIVLYFGDNGQFDPTVYDQMVREFPQVKSFVFIREAYSSKGRAHAPTLPGQIGFATTVDLGFELEDLGFLEAQDLIPIEKHVVEKLKKEPSNKAFGEVVFPWWYDCRDFKWRWDVREDQVDLLYLAERTMQRCE